MEIEFIKKRFPNDVRLQQIKIDAMKLDPASGKSEEEKALMFASNTMTKQDQILSTYIYDFIEKAYEEVANFGMKTRDEKLKTLQGYAAVKQTEISAKNKVETIIREDIGN